MNLTPLQRLADLFACARLAQLPAADHEKLAVHAQELGTILEALAKAEAEKASPK